MNMRTQFEPWLSEGDSEQPQMLQCRKGEDSDGPLGFLGT